MIGLRSLCFYRTRKDCTIFRRSSLFSCHCLEVALTAMTKTALSLAAMEATCRWPVFAYGVSSSYQ